MADDPRRDLEAGRAGERRAEPRSAVAAKVRCHFESVLDFAEIQAVNISATGMYLASDSPPPLGSRLEFEITLSDGFTMLAGRAEVVRVVTRGPLPGMGLRFLDLDPQYRTLIQRIVAVNANEGRSSPLAFDFAAPAAAAPPPPKTPSPPQTPPTPLPPFIRALNAAAPALASSSAAAPSPSAPAPAMPPVSPPGTAPALRAPPLRPLTASSAPSGLQPPLPAPATATDIVSLASPVHVEGRSLRLPLGPATVAHFTSNPLINVRSGGFFVPVDQDLALGTVLDVEIADGAGRPLLTGKGKVVAKQQLRIGVRLTEVDKEVLARLQGEVAKLAPRK